MMITHADKGINVMSVRRAPRPQPKGLVLLQKACGKSGSLYITADKQARHGQAGPGELGGGAAHTAYGPAVKHMGLVLEKGPPSAP